MYPMRPALLLPTFVGAWVGADDKLPMRQHAYNDPRAKDATELMVRALRDQAAYEAPLIDENNAFLLAASVFPYFYSLVGERNPKQAAATVGTAVSLFAAGLRCFRNHSAPRTDFEN
jgi:hypothetical protein